MTLLEPPRAHPPLGVLAGVTVGLLLAWYPLSLAIVTATAWPRLARYGAPAWLLLAVRAAVVVAGLIAARALLERDARGARLAPACLVAHAATAIVVAATPFFPSNAVPSTKWWWVAGAVVTNLALGALLARRGGPADPGSAP